MDSASAELLITRKHAELEDLLKAKTSQQFSFLPTNLKFAATQLSPSC